MERSFFWIIGGGQLQLPVLNQAKQLNYKIVISDSSPSCICANLSDIFFNIDIFDIDAHIKNAKNMITSGHKIVGVIAAGIDAPETAAQLCEFLNLPTVPASIAKTVHHKGLFRKAMEGINCPVPKYSIFDNNSIYSYKKIAESIGYPLIIKNTDSSASRGTRIFSKPDLDAEISVLTEAISISHSKQSLVESVWEGTEHTVETIFDVDGNFHRCFITDRFFDFSKGFAIEIGLRNPSTLSELQQNEMFLLAENTARNIGINIGAAKYDMIYTKDGPRIIEMTTRLSGGFDCQYLVPAATGKNVIKAAILTSLGVRFDVSILKNTKNRVALSESLWPEPGILKDIKGLEEIKKVDGFEHIFFRYKIGDKIEPYVDCSKRVCFIIASGKDEDSARASMNNIKDLLELIVEK
jgi:biotin carboxylase